jgi:hypothetical protein
MREVHQIQTGNSRIVYCESLEGGADWQTLIGEIDNFLLHNSGLTAISENVFLYFFEDSFNQLSGPWVAREVMGFENLEEHEDFALYDLHRSTAFCYKLTSDELGKINFENLFSLQTEIRKDISKGRNPAVPWRVRLKPRLLENGQLSLEGEIHFFEEILGIEE